MEVNLQKDCKNIKKLGFTLAEVLITLGIIGIVASMTLPALIQRQAEKANVVKLKKFYTVLQQAYQSTVNENSDPGDWGLKNDINGAKIVANNFLKYFKLQKNCGVNPGCFAAQSPVEMRTDNKLVKVALNDGTSLAFGAVDDCSANTGNSKELKNVCGWFVVDVNGKQKPNKYGQDTFEFYITKYNVIPYGISEDTKYPFNGSCLNSSAGIHGCTAWAIINENQDYLHCNDLSWRGKKKCK